MGSSPASGNWSHREERLIRRDGFPASGYLKAALRRCALRCQRSSIKLRHKCINDWLGGLGCGSSATRPRGSPAFAVGRCSCTSAREAGSAEPSGHPSSQKSRTRRTFAIRPVDNQARTSFIGFATTSISGSVDSAVTSLVNAYALPPDPPKPPKPKPRCEVAFPRTVNCSYIQQAKYPDLKSALEAALKSLPKEWQKRPFTTKGTQASTDRPGTDHTTYWSADGKTKISIGCYEECCRNTDDGPVIENGKKCYELNRARFDTRR
jgi:hypothetical protein